MTEPTASRKAYVQVAQVFGTHKEYSVARETARKAVRLLASEGLVYVVQGRGAYVARR
jgi:hypothetical protein